ncbi:MAG: hypothetical protein AMS17_19110 [Spirochaetes bacterium DG_61]|nr:MAG: hypothetical protein AMS17_19110 [Spirochaetes bacterium DG_61]
MIIMVKKILSDGSECRKCKEVNDFLKEKQLLDRIDKIVYADPRNPNEEGMKLAKYWSMKRAPFFIIEEEGRTVIYSSVMELIRKELQ